jgi:hypothetical protein
MRPRQDSSGQAPTIDHRGPQFAGLARQVLASLGRLCGTARPVALYLSDLSLAGALCGVEMGLAQAGVPITRDGVRAALDYLGSPA